VSFSRVEILLDHGADPTLAYTFFTTTKTPQEISRDDPQAEAAANAVRLLLARGADLSAWIWVAFQKEPIWAVGLGATTSHAADCRLPRYNYERAPSVHDGGNRAIVQKLAILSPCLLGLAPLRRICIGQSAISKVSRTAAASRFARWCPSFFFLRDLYDQAICR
jgi:hypothetical protein